MSQEINESIDRLSTRHVARNVGILRRFFEKISVDWAFELMGDLDKMRRLCSQTTLLKKAVKTPEPKRNVSYTIRCPLTPIFKPSANAIPSQQAQCQMMPPHQQVQVKSTAEVIEISGDSSCNNQSSEYFDANADSFCGNLTDATSKTSDVNANCFKTPTKSCPSPRTPENLPDAYTTPPGAPRRPPPQSRRGNFSRQAGSGSPRSTHQVRVVIDHPQAPGVRRIELDHNVDDEDIETVNRVIQAMAPAFDNSTVTVTATQAKIQPGRYKLYKNMRF